MLTESDIDAYLAELRRRAAAQPQYAASVAYLNSADILQDMRIQARHRAADARGARRARKTLGLRLTR